MWAEDQHSGDLEVTPSIPCLSPQQLPPPILCLQSFRGQPRVDRPLPMAHLNSQLLLQRRCPPNSPSGPEGPQHECRVLRTEPWQSVLLGARGNFGSQGGPG